MRRRGKMAKDTNEGSARDEGGPSTGQVEQEAAKGGEKGDQLKSLCGRLLHVLGAVQLARHEYRPSCRQWSLVLLYRLGPARVPVLARSRPGAAAAGCWRRGRGCPAAARRFLGRLGPLGACNGAPTGGPRGSSGRTCTGASTATAQWFIPGRGPAPPQGQAQDRNLSPFLLARVGTRPLSALHQQTGLALSGYPSEENFMWEAQQMQTQMQMQMQIQGLQRHNQMLGASASGGLVLLLALRLALASANLDSKKEPKSRGGPPIQAANPPKKGDEPGAAIQAA
ncbi:hypothetical protein BBK36DRAFT_1186734 [Trichoderma citrinoviride]|uniref:Uncharacterized protein n=1 Tax=Trichoderma citrinoviride TaxID=58853 RepID=A0A2T4BJ16_9HYPO|nr:hypothetical protein BBK36DRAFT_1186734 [Trichoderma citrinoviride]PTB69312.1 hypothetical protein BBK36DRAFT_1186734 [Trichoderma citrinoviride]